MGNQLSSARDIQDGVLEYFDQTRAASAFGLMPDEVVVSKRRVSAFTGTDLDILLRCYKSNHLIIAGLVTSGAVLSTIRQAQDMDFQITVLRDLRMDWDEEVHFF